MPKLVTLLTLAILAAGLLAGCGDKPGAPSQTSVRERQNDATAEAGSYDPIAQSAMVREALIDNATYHDRIMTYWPKEGQGLPEAVPTPAGDAGATTPPAGDAAKTPAPAGDTPTPAPAGDTPAPAPAGDAPAPAPAGDAGKAPAGEAPAPAPAAETPKETKTE